MAILLETNPVNSSRKDNGRAAVRALVVVAVTAIANAIVPAPALANYNSIKGTWYGHVSCQLLHKQSDFTVTFDDSDPRHAVARFKDDASGSEVDLSGYINYYLGGISMSARSPNSVSAGLPIMMSAQIYPGGRVSGSVNIRGWECGRPELKLAHAKFVAPELRKGPVTLPRLGGPIQQRVYEFAYQGPASRSDANGDNFGILPIDEVDQWLVKGGYKCIASSAVKLNKGAGKTRINMRQFGSKRYVLYCDKSCKGLHYMFRQFGPVTHWGISQPYPIVQIDSGLGSVNLDFDFAWNALPEDSMLALSQWSNDRGDYGGGCKETMFQGH